MITTLILLGAIIVLDLVPISVDVLVLSIMLVLIVYRYKRNSKLDPVFYSFGLLMAIVTLFFEIKYIRSGFISFGLYNVVLFTGVLPNKWAMTGKLKTYRVFFSILGFILIMPHALMNLFVDQQINLFGIGALVIMIPLFITSFNLIKKEMKISEWIKLQKAAYVVYLLLFIHLISVADWYGKVVYAVLMTLYVNNKLVKEFRK